MDVSDRRPQAQLTQEAKIASDFSLFRAIFAFAGFVSALRRPSAAPLKAWNTRRRPRRPRAVPFK